MTLRLATRSSPLALWQANTTRDLLAARGEPVELVHVSSSGDQDQKQALARFGRIGIFTVEVDRAVLEERAEIAVHSLKDMTTTLQEGLVLAGVLPRGPVEDAFVSNAAGSLAELPTGARVATGSLRRAASLRRVRPDLEVVDARGNVQTRLAKLDSGHADALVLARAGLERLGLHERIAEVLDVESFLPAVGQGIVGLVTRDDDRRAREACARIADPDALDSARAERAFLAELRGGCNVPAAGHATCAGDSLRLAGRVLATDGTREVAGTRSGPRADAEAIGRDLARELLDQGAGELIEAARREVEEAS